MKILVMLIVVLAVSFSVPNAFAQMAVSPDDVISMSLSSTSDTVTVTLVKNMGNLPLADKIVFSYDIGIVGSGVDDKKMNLNTGHTFEGLSPNTEYTVTVDISNYSASGSGPFFYKTIIQTINTKELVIIEEFTLNLSSTSDSVTVTWVDDPILLGLPNNVVLSFNLSIVNIATPDPNEIMHYEFVHLANTGHTFDGLRYNTGYIVKLLIYADDGTGLILYDDIQKTIYTKQQVIIEPPTIILSSTSDSVTVTWVDDPILLGLPNNVVLSFNLDISGTPDPNGLMHYEFVHLANTGHTFDGLSHNTEYSVILYAFYDEGQGRQFYKYFTQTIYTKDLDIMELEKEKNGSGCGGDCTPPTIGLDENQVRLVDNGFSYNNNPVDVIEWHTPYPLITAVVGQTNTVEIIAYDNGGIFKLAMVQFGLGLEGLGQPLHDVEVLIEVHLEALYSENKVIVEKVVIRDRDNLIDTFSVFAVTETVQCIDDAYDNKCLKVTLQYSYREATINSMMVVNVMDIARNTQNFYLNEGVEVIGDSMNPTPFVILPNKQTSQQTENLTKTLYRIDKVNNIWMDGSGIEYLKVGDNRFDRITPLAPITCNDTPLDQVKVPTRQNCHFRALTPIWD